MFRHVFRRASRHASLRGSRTFETFSGVGINVGTTLGDIVVGAAVGVIVVGTRLGLAVALVGDDVVGVSVGVVVIFVGAAVGRGLSTTELK